MQLNLYMYGVSWQSFQYHFEDVVKMDHHHLFPPLPPKLPPLNYPPPKQIKKKNKERRNKS